ncbi:MAG: hypothetical protein RJQ14_18635 [Marinoscillum sp.]
MRNLTINRLQYRVSLSDGSLYGADIPFRSGLNIIYGPNSVGKSSIIIGIIYALGAEKALGIFQNKQNPFKPEFYDSIKNISVTKSYVLLEISNGEKTITIFRYITGTDTTVVAIYDSTIENIDLGSPQHKLVAVGDGVMIEGGLQYYLFDFLKIKIVEVSKYDEGTSKLYFENLLPLFFVEQRAGWSQIQARQISRYGIRDVKKVVFEYLFGLARFNNHIKELERKDLLEKIGDKKRELKNSEENLLVMVNGKINDQGALIITKSGLLNMQMADLIAYLKDEYDQKEKAIEKLSGKEEESSEFENKSKDSLKRISYQARKSSDKIDVLYKEIASYTSYIERIEINKIKNQQLKKINNINLELNISTCPVCEQTITDSEHGTCKLCHQEIKRIATPEENLEFLEDEKRSFEKVRDSKQLQLRKERNELNRLKEKEKSLIEQFEHRIKTYYGKEIDRLRELVSILDTLKKEIGFYERSWKKWTDLNDLRKEIEKLEIQADILKAQINEFKGSKDDRYILNLILLNIQKNVETLNLLRTKTDLIAKIKLDENDNYTPYLEEYDIYNITSSSDNVRIILSYYLALLQTGVTLKLEEIETHYPNLLILDEPRQQNLDVADLTGFISLIDNVGQSNCQVILTTYSEGKEDSYKNFKPFIVYEMMNGEDKLLKKIEKTTANKH